MVGISKLSSKWLCGISAVTYSFIAFIAVDANAFDTKAKQAIMVDVASGAVLFAKDPDFKMHPSSMSKLMTLYMVFERLKDGSLKLTDTLPVSEKAWRMEGSKMFVQVGSQVAVEDLIRGIIVQSGNDACVVIAEGLMGSEEAFAEAMNKKAKEIGLTNSHFKNSTGWPDPEHYMTSRDLASLGQHLATNFPQYYHYFSETQFTYNGITQPNRNLLLNRSLGVDGLKTGHTEIAGYGITISGKKDGRRLVLVVNGLTSMAERAREAELIMQYGFRNFDNMVIFKANEKLDTANVWYGENETVPLVAGHDLLVSYPVQFKNSIKAKVTYQGPLVAPVKKGTHIADLIVDVPEMGEQTVPLVAGADVEKLSWFGALFRTAKYKWF